MRLCSFGVAAMAVVVGSSRSELITALALAVAGAGWLISVAICNISIQLTAPRWVAGRTLATFQAARSEEHTSELQSLMRITSAVFFLANKKKSHSKQHTITNHLISTQ